MAKGTSAPSTPSNRVRREVSGGRLDCASDLRPERGPTRRALSQGSLAGTNGSSRHGRKVKLANTLDQGDDAEVQALSPAQVRSLVTGFTAQNDGVPPNPDEEADGAQLQALQSKLEEDVVPYADFAVWCPYGQRLLRACASKHKFGGRTWASSL